MKGAKQCILGYFNRKLTVLDIIVDPEDTVNIERALDKTILEYINIVCGKSYWHIHPGLAILETVELLSLYMCCGFTEHMKMPWKYKKYFVGFVLPFWYLVDLIKELFVIPERHYIIKDKKLHVSGHFSRVNATYAVEVNGKEIFNESVGKFISKQGCYVIENFEPFAMEVVKEVQELLKTE